MDYWEYYKNRAAEQIGMMLDLSEVNHCCGMCKYWTQYPDAPGYGACAIHVSATDLGFDCYIGRKCPSFEPWQKLVATLEYIEV